MAIMVNLKKSVLYTIQWYNGIFNKTNICICIIYVHVHTYTIYEYVYICMYICHIQYIGASFSFLLFQKYFTTLY